MKLDPDCIRAILLTVEETASFGTHMRYDSDTQHLRLSDYSQDEIFYHARQCEFSGLITKVAFNMNPGFYIEDLSPAGHEFLANIRNDTNWNKTKAIAHKVGSFSLDAITKIAANVISNLINKQF